MGEPIVLNNINQPKEISRIRNIKPDPTKSVEECFNDLEVVAEKTLAILKERHEHAGLRTWNQMMRDNCLDLKICLHNLGFDISGRT